MKKWLKCIIQWTPSKPSRNPIGRRGRRLVSAKCREKMKAKRNKLFITQCVATAEQAAAAARCSSIFRRRQQIIGRKWPVIYWALYLFRDGADTFAAAASPSAWALKWQSAAGAQSRKEMASLWLRLKANKWVQLFLARTHCSSLYLDNPSLILSTACGCVSAHFERKKTVTHW